MSSSYPKSVDAIFGTAQTCAAMWPSHGQKFQIEAHAAGELTPSRQALDAVTSGAVDCAFTPLHFYFQKEAALSVAAASRSASTPATSWRGGTSAAATRSSTPL